MFKDKNSAKTSFLMSKMLKMKKDVIMNMDVCDKSWANKKFEPAVEYD